MQGAIQVLGFTFVCGSGVTAAAGETAGKREGKVEHRVDSYTCGT